MFCIKTNKPNLVSLSLFRLIKPWSVMVNLVQKKISDHQSKLVLIYSNQLGETITCIFHCLHYRNYYHDNRAIMKECEYLSSFNGLPLEEQLVV
jgi:hypothetical protein